MMHHQYDVFICHRRHDSAELSMGIHMYLNRHGVRTFCDLVDDPDYMLGNKIYDLICRTPIFLFVASAGALASSVSTESWVRQELDCAIASKRRLICIRTVNFKGKSLEPLPQYVLDLVTRPKVVLNSSAPSTAALRSLLDAITFSPTSRPQNNLGTLVLTSEALSEFITGVCNTIREGHRPSESVLNAIVKRCFGKPLSAATARDLIAAANHFDSANERSIVRRAIVAGMLRRLARDQTQARQSPDIRAMWPLLYSTLDRGSGLSIQATQSAQGFVVIPLYSVVRDGQIRELLRLHIWAPRTTNQNRSGFSSDPFADNLDRFAVHSHQPHARSWLLTGELRNTVYKLAPIPDGDSAEEGHALFSVSWDGQRCYNVHQTISRVINTGQRVQVEPECSTYFEHGQSYVVPAGEFHDTTALFGDSAIPLAATLFFFDAFEGWVEDATVVGPSRVDYSDCPRAFETDGFTLIDKLDQSIEIAGDANPKVSHD